jgi:hypothetical protein
VLGERDAGRFERGRGSGEPQQCDRAVAEQAGIKLYVEVQRAGDTKAVEPAPDAGFGQSCGCLECDVLARPSRRSSISRA